MAEAHKAPPPGKDFWDRLTWAKLLTISLLGAVLAGALVYFFGEPQFQAKASLLVSDRPDVMAVIAGSSTTMAQAGTAGALSGLLGTDAALTRLRAVVDSDTVTRELVRKYKLVGHLGETENGAVEKLSRSTRVRPLQGVGLTISVTLGGTGRVQSWLGLPGDFTSSEAQQLCAQIANDYIAALDKHNTQTAVKEAKATKEFILERQGEVTAKLERIEDALEKLQTRYELLDPQTKAAALAELSKTGMQHLVAAQAEAEAAAHSLSIARKQLSKEQVRRIAQEVKAINPILSPLQEKLAQLQVDLATDLESGKAAGHPDVVDKQAQIRSLQQQLQGYEQHIQASVSEQPNPIRDSVMTNVIQLEISLAGAQAQKARYETETRRASAQLASLPPVVREYARLSWERELQTGLLTTLTQRLELASIEEQRESSGKLQPLDAARVPERKSGPSTTLTSGVAFLLIAGVLGLGLARRRRLFSPEPLVNEVAEGEG